MSMQAVLITGVARGIGEATARRFLDRGVRVFGIDQETPPGDLALSGFYRGDLGDVDLIPGMTRTLFRGVSRLDAVVNNAAVQRCGPIDAVSPADFRRVLDVNLVAPFALVRSCLPLLERAAGAVVNVASVHAVATSREISVYAASKGGLVALTRAMGLELADRGIRVNAVLPGAVDTEMLQEGLARGGDAASACERLEAFGARHPLGRVGRPSEIARAIEYLADPERSPFVTGATLVVDGGVTARLSTETDL